jgi:hypothetical protein
MLLRVWAAGGAGFHKPARERGMFGCRGFSYDILKPTYVRIKKGEGEHHEALPPREIGTLNVQLAAAATCFSMGAPTKFPHSVHEPS